MVISLRTSKLKPEVPPAPVVAKAIAPPGTGVASAVNVTAPKTSLRPGIKPPVRLGAGPTAATPTTKISDILSGMKAGSQWPFKDHISGQQGGATPESEDRPTQLVATPLKPVVKPVGKKLVILPKGTIKSAVASATNAVPTERQQANLDAAGLSAPLPPPVKVKMGPHVNVVTQYPEVHVGSKVVITNGRFPWVKHWKPGDKGFIHYVYPRGYNPSEVDDADKYRCFGITIEEPKERKGQTTMMFRSEFAVQSENPQTIPSRKVTNLEPVDA